MVNERALVSRLQALQASERSYLQANAKQAFENSGKRLREMQAEKSIQENRLWREASVEHQRIKSMEDFLLQAGTILQTKQDSVKAMSAKVEKLAAQEAELAEEQQARDTIMTDLALHLMGAEPCLERNTKGQITHRAQHLQAAQACCGQCIGLVHDVMQRQRTCLTALQHSMAESPCTTASFKLKDSINELASCIDKHQECAQEIRTKFSDASKGSKAGAGRSKRRCRPGLQCQHDQLPDRDTALHSSCSSTPGATQKRKASESGTGGEQDSKRSRRVC